MARPRKQKPKAAVEDDRSALGETVVANVSNKLRVFISWSGSRSKALAQALHAWLPLVIHYAEPFLSEADIDAGERWADAVAGELEASNFGIICVTKQSVSAPWLLFEAGALAKSLQGSVIPLLLDLDFREITGPLAQFQAKKAEKQGLLEVVRAINGAATVPVPELRLDALFEALWPEFEKRVAAIPHEQSVSKAARSQTDVLEELVSSVRSLDSRFRDEPNLRFPVRRRSRSARRFALEAAAVISQTPDSSWALLVLSSIYEDDAPWAAEMIREIFQLARTGRSNSADRAARLLRHTLEFMGPRHLHADSGIDDEEILHLVDRVIRKSPRSRSDPTNQTPEPSAPSQPKDTGPSEAG